MGAELDKASIEKAYARWAPVYDFVFDSVMATGRKEAVAAAERCGPGSTPQFHGTSAASTHRRHHDQHPRQRQVVPGPRC